MGTYQRGGLTVGGRTLGTAKALVLAIGLTAGVAGVGYQAMTSHAPAVPTAPAEKRATCEDAIQNFMAELVSAKDATWLERVGGYTANPSAVSLDTLGYGNPGYRGLVWNRKPFVSGTSCTGAVRIGDGRSTLNGGKLGHIPVLGLELEQSDDGSWLVTGWGDQAL